MVDGWPEGRGSRVELAFSGEFCFEAREDGEEVGAQSCLLLLEERKPFGKVLCSDGRMTIVM